MFGDGADDEFAIEAEKLLEKKQSSSKHNNNHPRDLSEPQRFLDQDAWWGDFAAAAEEQEQQERPRTMGRSRSAPQGLVREIPREFKPAEKEKTVSATEVSAALLSDTV